MERLIAGSGVISKEQFSNSGEFFNLFGIIKKGHDECGDSVFYYSDEFKCICGVFDGVSGEANAANASFDAAASILQYLKKINNPNEKNFIEAISKGNAAISIGATTAVILFLLKNGNFFIIGVGDSPAYQIEKRVKSLIPLHRVVNEGDSILKFFHYRNLVTVVLGNDKIDIPIHIFEGKMETGEKIILASDGFSDNLFVKIKDGFIVDASGEEDIEKMIGSETNVEKIANKLFDETNKRIKVGRIENKNEIIIPKEDDFSLMVIQKN